MYQPRASVARVRVSLGGSSPAAPPRRARGRSPTRREDRFEAQRDALDPRREHDRVVRARGLVEHLSEDGLGGGELTRLRQHEAELRRQPEPALVVRRQERGSALEQAPRRVDVAARERATACTEEPVGRPARELDLRVAVAAELQAQAERLLQVVADDLVEVGSLDRAPLHPAGEALVQVGTRALRQRLVGRVPDQDVPEAETVLARDGATVGPDELLADEGLQVPSHVALLPGRRQLGDGAPEKHLAHHGRALQHRELVGLEPVEPGRKHRLHRSRHAERVDGGERLEASVPVDEQPVLDEHAQHLLEEERVAAGRAADRRRGLRVERPGELLEQLPRAWSWGSGASWIAGPSQPGRTSARSGRARQQTSTGASLHQPARYSTRSRNAGAAHCTSSSTTTTGCARASVSSRRRTAQKSSSLLERGSARPTASRIRLWIVSASGSPASTSPRSSRRTISTSGQNVIPVPYGGHLPSSASTSSPAEAISSAARRDLPTPGSPTIVTTRHSRSATTVSSSCRSRASSSTGRPAASPSCGRTRPPRGRCRPGATRRPSPPFPSARAEAPARR